MINAGAMMAAALVKPELKLADRFDYIQSVYRKYVQLLVILQLFILIVQIDWWSIYGIQ